MFDDFVFGNIADDRVFKQVFRPEENKQAKNTKLTFLWFKNKQSPQLTDALH